MTEALVPEVVEKPKLRRHKGGKLAVSVPKPKVPPVEGIVQAQAFEYYYALGETRTARTVAEKFGLKVSTVEGWGTRFKWVSRVQEREREVAARLRYETEDETIERRKNVLKIIDYCIANKLVKDPVTGKIIGVQGIDFKTVAEMTQFLELAERILHPGGPIAATAKPNGKEKGGDDGGTKILINITK